MPSTIVHVALAGLVAAALLGPAFGRRAVLFVLVVTVIPDLDAFAGLVIGGAHRSLGHNVLYPTLLAGVLAYDTRLRPSSLLRARWGDTGPRVAWVALAGLLVAGIGLDFVTNGVNLFWPLHDSFYTLNGKLEISNQRGLVQTFVDLSPDEPRTTDDVHYSTGVDPSPGEENGNPERVFPVVRSGWQFLLVAASGIVLGTRFWLDGATEDT